MLGEYIASAPLTSLVKPGGGIRPIAVGTVWRRLASKVSAIMIDKWASRKNGLSGFVLLSSASISVLVNGSPSREFKIERGLRQGDPLSPFLFLIVVEALQISIHEACNKGAFKGLKINLSKSKIYRVGVLADEVEVIASSLGCDHGSILFMYLGLPVGKRMRFSDGWNVVVNRFRDRLSYWRSKSLSIGGRLTLISSGGLGIGSIFAKKLCLFGKWKWRFLTDKEALWRMVIKELYGEDGGLSSLAASRDSSGVWVDNLILLRRLLEPRTLFPLSETLLLRLCNGVWDWRIPIRGRAVDDLSRLIDLIGNNSFSSTSDGPDKWVWSGDGSGILKVKIPRKVNVCVWRASLNRLPTRLNLAARGVMLPSMVCPFCDDDNEDIDHCLIRCPWVLSIWKKIWSWWHLDNPISFPSFSIKDIALGNIVSRGCCRVNKVIHGVLQCAL
ncbi:RNA-directed DNA polymerase, eukaryota, reverse transcriptase zinc-binding domain protein [Tanacetum coccineum]